MIYFLNPVSEIFTAYSKNDTDLYDILIINTSTRTYFVVENAYDHLLDFFDIEKGRYFNATYVERKIFDLLIKELEASKFVKKEIDF